VKLIIAIVQPNRLEQIKEALSQVEVFRLTVVDCLGYARQKGEQNAQRTDDGSIQLLRKLQLQIAVNEEFVEPTVQAILKGAKSEQEGRIGDGKIFVLPLEECVRIRTSERGPEAI
jgi:nitrogen regulatory protein P-II 1